MKDVVVIDSECGNVARLSERAVAKLLKAIECKANTMLSSCSARHIVYAIERRVRNEGKEIHLIPFTAYTDAKYAACFKGDERIPFAVHK